MRCVIAAATPSNHTTDLTYTNPDVGGRIGFIGMKDRVVSADYKVVDGDRRYAKKNQPAQTKPVPVEGRTWRYWSPIDGAEVLVRFHGGQWQSADPIFAGCWYTAGDAVLRWPGVFTEIA